MTIASTLARSRLRMALRMTDTVTVTRADGDPAVDATGTVTQPTTTVYTGSAEVKQRTEQPTVNASAGRDVTTLPVMLRLPWNSADLHDGDTVTVTASTHLPALVGHVFTVTGEDGSSHVTSRRYGIVKVTS